MCHVSCIRYFASDRITSSFFFGQTFTSAFQFIYGGWAISTPNAALRCAWHTCRFMPILMLMDREGERVRDPTRFILEPFSHYRTTPQIADNLATGNMHRQFLGVRLPTSSPAHTVKAESGHHTGKNRSLVPRIRQNEVDTG